MYHINFIWYQLWYQKALGATMTILDGFAPKYSIQYMDQNLSSSTSCCVVIFCVGSFFSEREFSKIHRFGAIKLYHTRHMGKLCIISYFFTSVVRCLKNFSSFMVPQYGTSVKSKIAQQPWKSSTSNHSRSKEEVK